MLIIEKPISSIIKLYHYEKTLLCYHVCVAALFSANAQSAESVSVKDLNYRFISKMPAILEESFTTADPTLADYDKGKVVKGYAFSLTTKMDVTIRLTEKGDWSSYLAYVRCQL